jgi:hypothetical protein
LDSKEWNWIELVTKGALTSLNVSLCGDHIGVVGQVVWVLDDLLLVRWVHVPGLVAVVGVEGWVRPQVNGRLELALLLDRFLLSLCFFLLFRLFILLLL